MFYILAWLLGVPLSIILLLFLFGIGRLSDDGRWLIQRP